MAEKNIVKLEESKDVQDDKAVDHSTTNAMKKCFHSVKVSKHDATKVQREIEGEIFDKWSEGCEVMNAKKISFSKINGYLDYLQGAYEGIDDAVLKDIKFKLLEEQSWEFKMVDWNFKTPDDSGIRYGMVAFGRSKDQQFVDCMYVLYKMDFKIAPHEIVTENKHSWLGGLRKYTTKEIEHVERTLGASSVKAMQNFFRSKALEGVSKEGLIESINYVDSLEDTTE